MFFADLSLSRGYDLTPWRRSASLVVDQSVTVKIYGDRQNIQDTEREITRFIQSLCTKADITDNLLNGLDQIEVKFDFSSPEPIKNSILNFKCLPTTFSSEAKCLYDDSFG